MNTDFGGADLPVSRTRGAAFQSARGLAHSKTLRVCRGRSESPSGFGLRQPSAAFPSPVHLKMKTGKEFPSAGIRFHVISARRVRFPSSPRLVPRAAFQSARGLAHSKTLRVCRGRSESPSGFGLRQPSAAFPPPVHLKIERMAWVEHRMARGGFRV